MDPKIETILQKYTSSEHATLIGLLQDILAQYRYLPEEVLREVSARLSVPLSRLYGLATFYKVFRLEPVGKHVICVCMGTACHVSGSERLVDILQAELAITSGQTTPDGLFTLETVNCLGACALAPLLVIDGEYHGKMDQSKLRDLVAKKKKEVTIDSAEQKNG